MTDTAILACPDCGTAYPTEERKKYCPECDAELEVVHTPEKPDDPRSGSV